jgi:hypothetical protein
MKIAFLVDEHDPHPARAVAADVDTLASRAHADVELITVVVPQQPQTGEAWSGSLGQAARERAEELRHDAPAARAALEALATGMHAQTTITVLSGDDTLKGKSLVDILGEHFQAGAPDLVAATVSRAGDDTPQVGETVVRLVERAYAPVVVLAPRIATGIADARQAAAGAFVFTADGIELGTVTANTAESIDIDGQFGHRTFAREEIGQVDSGRVALVVHSTELEGVR